MATSARRPQHVPGRRENDTPTQLTSRIWSRVLGVVRCTTTASLLPNLHVHMELKVQGATCCAPPRRGEATSSRLANSHGAICGHRDTRNFTLFLVISTCVDSSFYHFLHFKITTTDTVSKINIFTWE